MRGVAMNSFEVRVGSLAAEIVHRLNDEQPLGGTLRLLSHLLDLPQSVILKRLKRQDDELTWLEQLAPHLAQKQRKQAV